MYYHVVVKLKNDKYLSDTDKKDIKDIKQQFVIPYAQKKEFFIKSKIIKPDEIDEFFVLKSDLSFSNIYDVESKKYQQMAMIGFPKEQFVLGSNDIHIITNELLKDTTIIENKQNLFDNKKVFIVHGRDEEQQTIARFLEKLELEPIILHEQPNKGKTIIEQLEIYTNVAFGVVLYSPDDEFRLQGEKLKPRARQNVVFEHGYLVGKLGRDRVVAITKDENIEIPSDLSGIIYLNFKHNWQIELGRELISCGFTIDMNKVIK